MCVFQIKIKGFDLGELGNEDSIFFSQLFCNITVTKPFELRYELHRTFERHLYDIRRGLYSTSLKFAEDRFLVIWALWFHRQLWSLE